MSFNGASSGIYSLSQHALISRSVISPQRTIDIDRSGNPLPGSVETGRDRSSASKKIAIGETLKSAHETISLASQMLLKLSDKATSEYVERVAAMTEGQLCQIAFIGQMNAGKSTLINAIIGAPDFLPTEITPWTTVVTNIYFGVPDKPAEGAFFEFFDEAEWRQLAEGGGRVRSLTERTIPNFPWEAIHKQVSDMRSRAESKLGPRYQTLLGKNHSFETVIPGLLERYIAAESPLGDDDTATAGEFSTITKAAHIYSGLTSFLYPTVVIDTPGINDPYLIRDEITRQNLERGNIFVIVITARQALSNADLDLLRILRGLRKENIIIFINKIDEIDDFENHKPAIVGRTKSLLSREFPNREIPVIAGSAYWAEVALSNDVDEQRELIEADGFGLSSSSLSVNGHTSFWLSDPAAAQAVMAETILGRSAIPDLGVAISDMLSTGPVASTMQYAAASLLILSKNGLTRTEKNAELVKTLMTHSESDPATAAKIAVEQQAKLDEISAVQQYIDETIGQAQANNASIIDGTVCSLLDNLNALLQERLDASQEQPDTAGHTPSETIRLPIISKLRSHIEEDFSNQFQSALSRINAVVHDAERELQDKLSGAADALDLRIEYPFLPALDCTPSLAALSDPIATEFGGAVFASSWTKRLSPAEQDKLKSVIKSQFETTIERLSQSAREELEKTTHFIMDHFRCHVAHSLKLAVDQKQAILAITPYLSDPASHATDVSVCERLGKELKKIELEAGGYEGVLAEIVATNIDEDGQAE
ncbi:MAG: dynamin family protein [Hyphomicrobiales bacterium]|nr:dynamin family protein [Hyphomicrobiales bacterium]